MVGAGSSVAVQKVADSPPTASFSVGGYKYPLSGHLKGVGVEEHIKGVKAPL